MKKYKIMLCFSSILLAAALVAVSARAQDNSKLKPETKHLPGEHSSQTDAVSSQLKLPDTSSPGDTLRSFLTDMIITLDYWKQDEYVTSPQGYRASERAIATLDFSTTPYSNSRSVISRRILMLLEILGRMGLPPDTEIPGDVDVVQGNLKCWTIPGSGITIQRIENGPRAGEFLFSAWTVQRIPRFYHQIKKFALQIPCRPRSL